MKRLLVLLFSLAVGAAATATPAVACVSTPTLGGQHGCCGEQAVVASAPIGVCCFLSQPTSDRALTGSRNLTAKERHAPVDACTQPVWSAVRQSDAPRRASPSSRPGPPVSIYIQQLSLLI